MISEKLIEEAMDGRYDGINACDIAREVLELEAKLKAQDEEIAYLRNDLVDLDCACIAHKMDLSETDPVKMIDTLQKGIQSALQRSVPK